MTEETRGDLLADEALVALLRMLVHAGGGKIEVVEDNAIALVADGDFLDFIGKMTQNFAMKARIQQSELDPASRMLLAAEMESQRYIIDSMWQQVHRAMPLLVAEVNRRMNGEANGDDSEDPAHRLN